MVSPGEPAATPLGQLSNVPNLPSHFLSRSDDLKTLKAAVARDDEVRRALFISHASADEGAARELARGLEASGLKTWYYERDNVPGPSYLAQIVDAIDSSDAIIMIVSAHAFGSRQMDRELVYAYERERALIPILLGITHAEFQTANPDWRLMVGASSSISVPAGDVSSIVPEVVKGVSIIVNAQRDRERLLPSDPSRTREQRPSVADARTTEVGLAVDRRALEHVLRARLSSTDHDVIKKASKVGLDQLTDANLRQLLNALGWSGTIGLSPPGLLIHDFATRVVARLEKLGPLGSDVHASMARLLAQTEKALGVTNRYETVQAFEYYRKRFDGDPQAASKWLAMMQTYRGNILERLAVYGQVLI